MCRVVKAAGTAPTITSLNYAQGDTAGGGQDIVITGTDFTGATAVTFLGTNATSYTVDSSTQITAVLPAHAAGTGDVEVTTPGGSDTIAFEYWDPASISNIVHRWRADQGIATASGGEVTQWDDLVGSADLVQSTGSLRPPAPTTDADYGNQDVLALGDHEFEVVTATTFAASDPLSVFMVGAANTALAHNSLWLFSTSSPYYMFWKKDVAGLAQFFTAMPAVNTTEDVTTPHAYLVEDDDTLGCAMYMQSLASANATATSRTVSSVSSFSIGTGAAGVNRGQSEFAECFIVKAIMSTTEKRKLCKYVSQRYAITVPAP
jgi:hypothetical protein